MAVLPISMAYAESAHCTAHVENVKVCTSVSSGILGGGASHDRDAAFHHSCR
jgi:hypothetical protein